MITTEAWVLHRGTKPYRSALETGEFRKEAFSFPDLEDDEILVEPLFGSWEGNTSHAIARSPIDICAQRKEDSVVLGNAGLIRVLRPHHQSGLREGDLGILFGAGKTDPLGYMTDAYAYDMPGTSGLMAKQAKMRAWQFLPLPQGSRFTYEQWAAYGVKYLTAWANWKVAYGAYRLQVSEEEDPTPRVWGWGGGTTFAELDLARRRGCEATIISGSSAHLEMITNAGVRSVDRRQFPDLQFDEQRFSSDAAYRAAYQRSEQALLRLIQEQTEGRGVSIFIDYIGSPVARVTLKALGRQGVLTTAGWMLGMNLSVNRAVSCIRRNLHVYTHYARLIDWKEASEFSCATGWMPPATQVYAWDDVGELARAAAAGAIPYFPLYAINPV